MYKNFYNSLISYPEEKIIVTRNLEKNLDECISVESKYPGIKDECTKLLANGYFVKRCLPNVYTNNKHLNSFSDKQLIGNIYMYKHLIEMQ